MQEKLLKKYKMKNGAMKIKVVHVYKSFNVYNGLIEILSILADNIDHNRFELTACVNEYNGNEFGENFIKKGGKIKIIKNEKLSSEYDKINNLYRYFIDKRPHIVQTHVLRANLTATLTAKSANVPVIIATEMTLRNIAPPGLKRLRDFILQVALQYSLTKCDRFIVTSDYLKKEWSPRWLQKKTEIIYPPFSIEKFKIANKNEKPKRDENRCVIGFVGRLSEEKRVDDLLRAIKIVKDKHENVNCLIVGTGPEEGKLKKLVSELNLSHMVSFTGYSKNSFEKLLDFDIFVLPSRTEGCPIVILEAMASGLPVVATNVGGNMELVQDDVTGILVPTNNPFVMAEKICKLITNKNLRLNMGKNGKSLAFSKFAPEKFSKGLIDVYLNLMKEKKIDNCY
jgi:glycosyltransferase involved in cell wall biosynthesis